MKKTKIQEGAGSTVVIGIVVALLILGGILFAVGKSQQPSTSATDVTTTQPDSNNTSTGSSSGSTGMQQGTISNNANDIDSQLNDIQTDQQGVNDSLNQPSTVNVE